MPEPCRNACRPSSLRPDGELSNWLELLDVVMLHDGMAAHERARVWSMRFGLPGIYLRDDGASTRPLLRC